MTRQPPLVVAAHGTRQAEGLASCRALVDRVAGRLPAVQIGRASCRERVWQAV